MSVGKGIIIAFDIGRMLPNIDLSRDFMELVVDGLVDLGGADEKEPGIEFGLGLFDLFFLALGKTQKAW